MKPLAVALCSLGAMAFLTLWIVGQFRLLALDLDTAPIGRHVHVEEEGGSFSVLYGDYLGPGDPERPERITFTYQKALVLPNEGPSFLCGTRRPGSATHPDDPPHWLILRFPSWYAFLLFAAGLLVPVVRARLLRLQPGITPGKEKTGLCIRLCDGAILAGLLLVTVSLFWAGSFKQILWDSPTLVNAEAEGAVGPGRYVPRALFGVGLAIGIAGLIGYDRAGRRQPADAV